MRVDQLVSVVSGYSLNYFHWMTELLPGLIRLRPLILADPNVREPTSASNISGKLKAPRPLNAKAQTVLLPRCGC